MNKTIFKYIVCVSLMAFGVSTHAQVTIGDATPPEKGTLLQLKDGTNGDSGINAKGGLGLPRVGLLSKTLDATTYNNLSKTIKGATGTWDKDAHIGLMVYNVSESTICDPLPEKGVYVWDGSSWQLLDKKEADVRDVRTITDDGTKVTISYNGETTSYRYATFGYAGTWLIDNLATKYLPNGDISTKYTENSYTKPQYILPSIEGYPGTEFNEETLQSKGYGFLYNKAAAMAGYLCPTGNQSPLDELSVLQHPTPQWPEVEIIGPLGTAPHKYVQGICPDGWHLPSLREFDSLAKYIRENKPYALDLFNPLLPGYGENGTAYSLSQQLTMHTSSSIDKEAEYHWDYPAYYDHLGSHVVNREFLLVSVRCIKNN